MNNRYDVFISYSRKDFCEVSAFVTQLQRFIPGLRCWFDLTGIESGDEFGEKIVSAIDSSDHVLFMISDASMTSVWTKKEVTYAKNIGKRVVPILLKGAQIKGWFLFEYGLIDSIDSSDSNHIDKLLQNLSTWTGKERIELADTEVCSDIKLDKNDRIEQTKQFLDNMQYRGTAWLYRTFASLGHSDSQDSLGFCYYNGYGVEQDYVQAVKWWRKSAARGNSNAQYNLGVAYYNGYGVEQDYVQAVKWWRKSVAQGNSSAQYYLGDCYYNGYGVTIDYIQAVALFRKAAEQGNADAQNALGRCYYYGYGVNKDYAQAVQWWHKSAAQTNFKAQYNLGVAYYNGYGVEQDYVHAVNWYRKSAEQGYSFAQYKLGYCYEKGQGVNSDSVQAEKWYKKAAEQGNKNSVKRLREMNKL